MKMSFINSLNTITINNKYILNLNYYISRFNVSFTYENNNVENIIRYLKRFFITYQKPYAFYINSNHHFDKKFHNFLNNKEITIDYNLLTFYKSINIIEIMNRILKRVVYKLKKK